MMDALPPLGRWPCVMVWRALSAVLLAAFSSLAWAQATPPSNSSSVQLKAQQPQDYIVDAGAGEYISVTLEANGIVIDAQLAMPDGTLMKRFSAATGRLTIPFVAEQAGQHRIRLTASSDGEVGIRIAERMSQERRLTAMSVPTKGTIITTLEKELQAAGSRDTSKFWQTITSTGTPVVESLPDTKELVQVTFLWRGTPNTRNAVVVGSSFLPPAFRYNVMSRVGDTDVWFLTRRFPAGARFAYGFAINGPLVFEGDLFPYQMANRQADPLNRTRVGCRPDGTQFECLSYAELPGAAPQPWIVPSKAVPHGTLDSTRFKSAILQNERSISVFTPAGYKSTNDPYELLVLFDEGTYLAAIPAATILDNLIAARRIRPLVAVLVGNVNRDRELAANPEFARFIAEELTPWVRKNYRVTTDPRRATIGGSSLGGLAAAYTAMKYPQTFNNVIALSGAFWWAPEATPGDPANAANETGWLTKQFVDGPKLPLRFWMAAGTFETDPTGSGGAILETTRHLRDVLLAKGYSVQYQQFPGGHDAYSWRGLLPEALMALIPSP